MARGGPLVAIEVVVEVAGEQDVGVGDVFDIDPDPEVGIPDRDVPRVAADAGAASVLIDTQSPRLCEVRAPAVDRERARQP